MIPLAGLLEVGGKLIDKLIPDPEAKAKAQLELATLAQNGKLAEMANETKLFEVDQNNITDRWKADMASDSWLSKNIRPLSLVAIFSAYVVFALMSAFNLAVNADYVELLGQWGIIIFGAYFTSRGAEKIMDMKVKK
jgi:Holin of 3TMs, for gene-transfer release